MSDHITLNSEPGTHKKKVYVCFAKKNKKQQKQPQNHLLFCVCDKYLETNVEFHLLTFQMSIFTWEAPATRGEFNEKIPDCTLLEVDDVNIFRMSTY